MTIDDHVKQASRLNALEQRLRDALRDLDKRLHRLKLPRGRGSRKVIADALAEADRIEQARKDRTP